MPHCWYCHVFKTPVGLSHNWKWWPSLFSVHEQYYSYAFDWFSPQFRSIALILNDDDDRQRNITYVLFSSWHAWDDYEQQRLNVSKLPKPSLYYSSRIPSHEYIRNFSRGHFLPISLCKVELPLRNCEIFEGGAFGFYHLDSGMLRADGTVQLETLCCGGGTIWMWARAD